MQIFLNSSLRTWTCTGLYGSGTCTCTWYVSTCTCTCTCTMLYLTHLCRGVNCKLDREGLRPLVRKYTPCEKEKEVLLVTLTMRRWIRPCQTCWREEVTCYRDEQTVHPLQAVHRRIQLYFPTSLHAMRLTFLLQQLSNVSIWCFSVA